MAKPDLITCNWHHYLRPPCTPSFIKSRKFPYYQHISDFNTFMIFLLYMYVYTYTRGTLGCLLGFWPPGQNPAGAITRYHFLHTCPHVTDYVRIPIYRQASILTIIILKYRGFALQPCWAMSHGRNDRFFLNKCKIFSLFLPCNMAAMQNLYTLQFLLALTWRICTYIIFTF